MRNFFTDATGATAIEYGLISALLALAILAIAYPLAYQMRTEFVELGNGLKPVSGIQEEIK